MSIAPRTTPMSIQRAFPPTSSRPLSGQKANRSRPRPPVSAVHLACRLCRPRINCSLVRHVHIALMGALLVAISHSAASALAAATGQDPQSNIPPADTSGLNFHQFGLLAIQDGGRRKPIDTFARETLIRITGRSTYSDKTGRKWQPNDF